jgi:hypothetical protein
MANAPAAGSSTPRQQQQQLRKGTAAPLEGVLGSQITGVLKLAFALIGIKMLHGLGMALARGMQPGQEGNNMQRRMGQDGSNLQASGSRADAPSSSFVNNKGARTPSVTSGVSAPKAPTF